MYCIVWVYCIAYRYTRAYIGTFLCVEGYLLGSSRWPVAIALASGLVALHQKAVPICAAQGSRAHRTAPRVKAGQPAAPRSWASPPPHDCTHGCCCRGASRALQGLHVSLRGVPSASALQEVQEALARAQGWAAEPHRVRFRRKGGLLLVQHDVHDVLPAPTASLTGAVPPWSIEVVEARHRAQHRR